MIKIEANTLREAYEQAAKELNCSAKELKVEVIQKSSPGIFGLFKKRAIIVASQNTSQKGKEEDEKTLPQKESKQPKKPTKTEDKKSKKSKNQDNIELEATPPKKKQKQEKIKADKKENEKTLKSKLAKELEKKPKQEKKKVKKQKKQEILNDTIMPPSLVSDQDDDHDEELNSGVDYTADYDDALDENNNYDAHDIVDEIKKEINTLFDLTCFKMQKIKVSAYDENTILIELKGDDSALLIGKEGYRYKALSYMLYNWINAKYDMQVRLEIAEFLKNQEESVDRYLINVCENIEKDGRAQTKILDGVLVQIALRKLREVYPNKYVVIRSTKDGQKYIIVNDYHSN